MGPEKIDVVVIGEGISGLAIGHWLKKQGIAFRLLAKETVPGGTMQSVREEGFLVEVGPNSALETTPLFRELVSDLALENEFTYAEPAGKNRYILRGGRLMALPLSPPAFLTTKLFSTGAKLRVLKEPFVGRATEEESVAQFVSRRLGREFMDYAIDPFVAGVFAGRPDRLSVRSAFPKLYALEEKYGGLVKGMFRGARERKARAEKAKDRAETFSFRGGMQVLPKAIAAGLGSAIVADARVTGIRDLAVDRQSREDEPGQRRYLVEYLHHGRQEEIEADTVVFAVPAYEAASVLRSFSRDTSTLLESIYYPPVLSIFLGFRRQDVGHPLDGFGFLVPTLEQRRILGCLWNSSLFVERAPAGHVAVTTFIGGARQPELTTLTDDEAVQTAVDELRGPMQIHGNPVYLKVSRWKRAIPQYELGYARIMDALTAFENEHPGIVFAGNYRGGISVGDCVRNSHEIAGDVGRRLTATRQTVSMSHDESRSA